MRRFLLDTDHISLQERGHEGVLARMAGMAPEEIAISGSPSRRCFGAGWRSVEEMLRGRLALLARRSEAQARVWAYAKLMETVRFADRIRVLPFDMGCEKRMAELRSQGLRVGTQDLRIAATALIHGLTVVTRNRRDFGMVPGLTLEDWSV